jgi:hypothetical protein
MGAKRERERTKYFRGVDWLDELLISTKTMRLETRMSLPYPCSFAAEAEGTSNEITLDTICMSMRFFTAAAIRGSNGGYAGP